MSEIIWVQVVNGRAVLIGMAQSLISTEHQDVNCQKTGTKFISLEIY